jgi:small subunit ribosomal protein S1
VEGKVTGRNKGGFEVNVSGLRAFCPLSQIALGKIENPDAFVNQTIEFRVTELSDDGRRIVVSRAALLKEAAASAPPKRASASSPGAELTGRVKTLTPFGAFVDLGGVDGLPARLRDEPPPRHRSEGRRPDRPGSAASRSSRSRTTASAFAVDERIRSPDPWSDVAERYTPGTQFTAASSARPTSATSSKWSRASTGSCTSRSCRTA